MRNIDDNEAGHVCAIPFNPPPMDVINQGISIISDLLWPSQQSLGLSKLVCTGSPLRCHSTPTMHCERLKWFCQGHSLVREDKSNLATNHLLEESKFAKFCINIHFWLLFHKFCNQISLPTSSKPQSNLPTHKLRIYSRLFHWTTNVRFANVHRFKFHRTVWKLCINYANFG